SIALITLALLAPPVPGNGEVAVYEGTWLTTANRKLDGPITCMVTSLGENRWRGHFSGSWQGMQFSYLVDFEGPPDKLRGRAFNGRSDSMPRPIPWVIAM